MQDLETKSLWSQISGVCIQGEMEGTKLEQVPFSHTTFAAFKKQYPNGKLLKKPADSPSGSTYDFYFADKDKLGIFGRVDNFQRLAGKDKIYGLRLDDKQVAISLEYLEKNGYAFVVQDSLRIHVIYDRMTATVVAKALPHNVEPYSEGYVAIPDSTLQTVDEILGKPYPIISAYWFAWASFFPETELIK